MYHTYIDGDVKYLRSANYNYNFNLKTGEFQRWGKTFDDDPEMCPFGPEIWDCEISEQCSMGCEACYKSNVANCGRNMSFETFAQLFDVIPPTLTQIAFGVGDLSSNPDIWKIMEHCRNNNVIPNITIHGNNLTDFEVKNLVKYCGAVSVSRYDNKDICYNAIKFLQDAGLKQVNIHQLLSFETQDACFQVLKDYKNDKRLKNLNAIVFLALKKKGRGINFNRISDSVYEQLIEKAINENIPFGFDSCSASRFISTTARIDPKNQNMYELVCEPCESSIFSMYSNVEGKYFPCSFAEDVTEGIDVTKVKDFVNEVWNHKYTCQEREKLLCNGRNCPYFEI